MAQEVPSCKKCGSGNIVTASEGLIFCGDCHEDILFIDRPPTCEHCGAELVIAPDLPVTCISCGIESSKQFLSIGAGMLPEVLKGLVDMAKTSPILLASLRESAKEDERIRRLLAEHGLL